MPARPDAPALQVNLATPTFGGLQLWGDELLLGGWRVQAHCWTGRCRLLDPSGIRRARGDLEACAAALQAVAEARGLQDAPRLALLVHGMGSFTGRLRPIADGLRASGRDAATFCYPSTRGGIADHAARLGRVIARLEGVAVIDLVGHSMGGLVIRALLGAPGPWRERVEVGRVVTIATPHRGSELAARFRDTWGYASLMGPAGSDVAADRADALPPLRAPFGLIAAGRGDERGFNPLLPGDDDGVVSLASTAHPGAADRLFVRARHNEVLSRPETIAAVRSFLERGRFDTPGGDPEGAPGDGG